MSYNLTGSAFGGNVTFGKAGLVAGTTTTYTIATAFPFAIAGRLFTGAAASNAATPTLDALTGLAFKGLVLNQACIFAFFMNASSVVSVAQGPIVSNLDLTGGLAAAQFPQASDALTPFGYLLAQAGPTTVGTWLFGTNNLSGVTGLTYSFRDVMDYPAQPITS